MKLSEMSVEELKQTPYFHMVDSSKLNTLEEYTYWLEAILHNPCNVWEENGEMFLIEIRQLVARVDGLKLEIRSNEHPPPHFHVITPNINASFDIESCNLIKGEISGKDRNKIIFWHKHSKQMLINIWDSTRPTNCVVGKYKGT